MRSNWASAAARTRTSSSVSFGSGSPCLDCLIPARLSEPGLIESSLGIILGLQVYVEFASYTERVHQDIDELASHLLTCVFPEYFLQSLFDSSTVPLLVSTVELTHLAGQCNKIMGYVASQSRKPRFGVCFGFLDAIIQVHR